MLNPDGHFNIVMRLIIWVVLVSTFRTKSFFSTHTTWHFWRLPITSIPPQTCLTFPVRSYGTLGKPPSPGLSTVITVARAFFPALYKHVIIFCYKPGARKEDLQKEDNSVGYEPFLCSSHALNCWEDTRNSAHLLCRTGSSQCRRLLRGCSTLSDLMVFICHLPSQHPQAWASSPRREPVSLAQHR